MKKFNYKMVSLSVICLALGQLLLAQAPIAPPPPVPAPEGPDKADQTEIVIRQKGDKDTKLTLEIKNGDYFINGKPLEKFDDQNVSVEKREINERYIRKDMHITCKDKRKEVGSREKRGRYERREAEREESR